MKTIIIYDSRNGTTEDCAINIKKSLNCDSVNLRKQSIKSIDEYSLIVIGTPLYMGHPLKRIKSFCRKNENKLLNKHIAFFVCGLGEPKAMIEQFKNSIPSKLIDKAEIISHFGGEIRPEKAHFFEKLILQKMLEDKKMNNKINNQEIITFINKLKDVK